MISLDRTFITRSAITKTIKYIIRLNPNKMEWEIINLGATYILKQKIHLMEFQTLFADIMLARFYEIVGTGTSNLVEATQRLRKHDPTLIQIRGGKQNDTNSAQT